MWIYGNDYPVVSFYNISVNDNVKYLGFKIKVEWMKISKEVFDLPVSIFGSMLLSKMESISRIIYPAYSLELRR